MREKREGLLALFLISGLIACLLFLLTGAMRVPTREETRFLARQEAARTSCTMTANCAPMENRDVQTAD